MAAQLTFEEVLGRAIQKEIEAQRLYTALSRVVRDAATKDAFRGLSQEEKRHQKGLERYLRRGFKSGALSKGYIVDYKIAEFVAEPEISTGMELKDTFLLAAHREKASHDFYSSLARIHPKGEARDLLREMASQELGHKQRVETLYTEVAFPQTDGG